MSEPKADPEPASDAASVKALSTDAASVAAPDTDAASVASPDAEAAQLYDELSFDRAPEPAPLPVVEPSVGRAVAFGSGAAVLGALVYFGVRALTGYELGLIAIGVGIAVGVAVRTGASGSSHRGFRFLAIGLAYASIVATYVPSLIQASHSADVDAALIVSTSFFALIVPFLMLRHGEFMSVVILAIALWEAWKFSAPQPVFAKPPPAL